MIDMVIFCSQADAEKAKGNKKTGLISITSPPMEGLINGGPANIDESKWGSVLRLEFDDVDQYDCDGLFTPFSEQHATDIISWVLDHEDEFNTIVVHCHAGISRSAAVARFIAGTHRLDNFNYYYTLYNKYVYKVLCSTLFEKF